MYLRIPADDPVAQRFLIGFALVNRLHSRGLEINEVSTSRAGIWAPSKHVKGCLFDAFVADMAEFRVFRCWQVSFCTMAANLLDSLIFAFCIRSLRMDSRSLIFLVEVAFSRAATRMASSSVARFKKKGFDAVDAFVPHGVGVDRDEQIGVLGVGDSRALFQGEVPVGGSRQHRIALEIGFHFAGQALGNLQHDMLFMNTFQVAGRAVILAAVAGVDDDAADAQGQLTCDGTGRKFARRRAGTGAVGSRCLTCLSESCPHTSSTMRKGFFREKIL
jgi:hypothetical protein